MAHTHRRTTNNQAIQADMKIGTAADEPVRVEARAREAKIDHVTLCTRTPAPAAATAQRVDMAAKVVTGKVAA